MMVTERNAYFATNSAQLLISMVFQTINHWLQWFSYVVIHWLNNAMVTIHTPCLGALSIYQT